MGARDNKERGPHLSITWTEALGLQVGERRLREVSRLKARIWVVQLFCNFISITTAVLKVKSIHQQQIILQYNQGVYVKCRFRHQPNVLAQSLAIRPCKLCFQDSPGFQSQGEFKPFRIYTTCHRQAAQTDKSCHPEAVLAKESGGSKYYNVRGGMNQ